MKACWRLMLLVVILAGCVDAEYDIELTPAGDSLERNLTLHRRRTAPADVADEELERLAKEYDAESPDPANRNTFRFRGRFAGRMPNDVGGYGTFTRWASPLGSVLIYIERFRGSDDAAGELKRRQAAADRLADLLAGWLETELRDEPAWPALHKSVEEDVRRDLCNLGIYAWTIGLAPPTKEPSDAFARMLQYLVERNYLTYDEIPAIWRLVGDSAPDKDERLLRWCERIILARVPDGTRRPRLDFLTSVERVESSLRAYLETTDEYASLSAEWKALLGDDPEAARPDALDVPGPLLKRLFAGMLPVDHVEAGVLLNTGKPAIYTNGSFLPEPGRMRWPRREVPAETSVPTLVYAVWDEPDAANQKGAFGRIVLQGEPLFEYCLWYRGLTDGERREWDGFVRTLRPDAGLEGKLQEFRFSQEPIDANGQERIAGRVVRILVRELNRGS